MRAAGRRAPRGRAAVGSAACSTPTRTRARSDGPTDQWPTRACAEAGRPDPARSSPRRSRAGQGPAARLRHDHRHPGDQRPAATRRSSTPSTATTRSAPARPRPWRAPRACCGRRWGAGPASGSPRRSTFVADAMPENARHIEDLLVEARPPTPQVPRLLPAAVYAGDPDPYRVPREDDEDDEDAPTRPADGHAVDVTRDGRGRLGGLSTVGSAGGRTPAPSGLVVVDKPAGLDLARRRRPDAPPGRHPPGRARRHARPDGHRRAACSGSSGPPSCSATSRSTDKTYLATIRLGAGDRHRRRRG